MILGTGIDLVNKARIEKIYQKFGSSFLNRIMVKNEIVFFNQMSTTEKKIAYLAKRFAAKEAFAKALGYGIGQIVSFQDIAVINDNYGAPKIELSEKLQNFIQKTLSKTFQTHLSITDEKQYAIAQVIIEYQNIKT